MKTILLSAALLLAASSATADQGTRGAKLHGNADRGHDVMGMWCSSCHSEGRTLDDRIPSIPVLARNLARSEGAIRAFLMNPHSPMPPVELSSQQIEDIVAYLRTVAPESPR